MATNRIPMSEQVQKKILKDKFPGKSNMSLNMFLDIS